MRRRRVCALNAGDAVLGDEDVRVAARHRDGAALREHADKIRERRSPSTTDVDGSTVTLRPLFACSAPTANAKAPPVPL